MTDSAIRMTRPRARGLVAPAGGIITSSRGQPAVGFSDGAEAGGDALVNRRPPEPDVAEHKQADGPGEDRHSDVNETRTPAGRGLSPR